MCSHCHRSKTIVSNNFLLTPKHGRRKSGEPALTYTDIDRGSGVSRFRLGGNGEQKGIADHSDSRTSLDLSKQAHIFRESKLTFRGNEKIRRGLEIGLKRHKCYFTCFLHITDKMLRTAPLTFLLRFLPVW